MKIAVYNSNAEKISELEINDAIFGVKPKVSVIHQVYVAMRNNARETLAHTKNRGDVQGGGKKPWKQKGTGRARHGSIRSPIWRGGGITFGPRKERNYEQKINKKTNVLATRMCLSEKIKNNRLWVLDEFIPVSKTKEFVGWFSKFPDVNRSCLMLLDAKNPEMMRTSRNLKKLILTGAKDANVVDILNANRIITTKKGMEILAKRLS